MCSRTNDELGDILNDLFKEVSLENMENLTIIPSNEFDSGVRESYNEKLPEMTPDNHQSTTVPQYITINNDLKSNVESKSIPVFHRHPIENSSSVNMLENMDFCNTDIYISSKRLDYQVLTPVRHTLQEIDGSPGTILLCPEILEYRRIGMLQSALYYVLKFSFLFNNPNRKHCH